MPHTDAGQPATARVQVGQLPPRRSSIAETLRLPELHGVDDATSWDFPGVLATNERQGHPRARVGVALSGGGIRSATFSLGFFQGLTKRGLLGSVDYLSTVSGGGYFGSFLGRLFCRDDLSRLEGSAQGRTSSPDQQQRPLTPAEKLSAVQNILLNPGAGPVRFLRENGRYLTPGGGDSALLGGAVALRNWAAVQIVMIVTGLAVLSVLELVAYSLYRPLSPWTDALEPTRIWVAPAVLAALVITGAFILACGWGYWIVPETPSGKGFLGTVLRVILAASVGLFGFWLAAHRPEYHAIGLGLAWATGIMLGFFFIVAVIAAAETTAGGLNALNGFLQVVRTIYTVWLARGLFALGIILLFGIVDVIGVSLVRAPSLGAWVSSLYGSALAIAIAVRPALQLIMRRVGKSDSFPLPLGVLAGAVGILILILALGALDAIPHALVRDPTLSAPVSQGAGALYSSAESLRLSLLLRATGGFVLLALAVGWTRAFVNRSSLYSTYEARLRRSYLGASNWERLADHGGSVALADSHPEDSIPFAQYHPEQNGGPIHLINVTVNETVEGRSQVERRDRKGLGFALGPGGVSAGVSHHATWKKPSADAVETSKRFHVFPDSFSPEALDLGQWVAISGAAFSTGLGARTSLGFSLLAGLANVRLGYWWDSGILPRSRPGRTKLSLPRRLSLALHALFPVQGAILDEWLAQFHGVALKYWYLTDGGHFENMAVYELIRRRLPLIVVCDNGADPEYTLEDLGNLVRKARIDFGAEIRFLSRQELDRILPAGFAERIGDLDSIRRAEPGEGAGVRRASAALAKVTYRPRSAGTTEEGWLLLIKPNVVGDEPVDIRQYHAEHSTFPQESTLDQSFDEAQWESYRRLGEHIATMIFEDTHEAGRWTPAQAMRNPDVKPAP